MRRRFKNLFTSLVLVFLLASNPILASYTPLNVQENDGSPIIDNVKKIKVQGGTVADQANGTVLLTVNGDITADSNLTDNAIVRGDGGGKKIQTSGIIIDDSDNLTGVTSITVDGTTGNTVIVDTTTFVVDATNNRVGINDSSPGTALDVTGTINATAQINGQTANFTTGNITTVNATTGNITTVNAATVNGATFDGSFTNGSILFSSPSGVISQDNANIFYDNQNDKFLIGGTTAAGADSVLAADGSAIFNEQGSAVNFRVESDSNANMLFVDGTNNRIGIGTNAPTTTLDVNGPLRVRSGSPALNYVLASVDTTGLTSWKSVTDILTNGGAFLNALNDVISDKSSNLFLGNGSGLVNNGEYNTSVGILSMGANSSGNGNTALGYMAGNPNTRGNYNVALGTQTLNGNDIGAGNIALGYKSLYTTNGDNNLGLGYKAGYGITTGDNNITIGYQAGDNVTSGNRNIILGYDIDAVSATANDQINIGNTIYGNASSGKISIGNSTNAPDAVLEVGNATAGNIDGTNDLIVADDVEIDDDLFVNDAATVTGNTTFSSMTAGSMLFAGTAGLLSQDNSKLFYDDATDKVLLGGATAGAASSILGADGSVIINEQGSAVNTRIESDNKTHLFFTDGTNDKVAIGDATPLALLDVGGGTLTNADGTDDILVKDDVEINDDLFVNDDAVVAGTVTATNFNGTTANISGTVNGGVFDGDFTNGSLLFSNEQGIISQNNAKLFWNRTNSSLGIGTPSTNTLLTLNGAAAFREIATQGATLNFGKVYVSSANHRLYFKDNGGALYNLTNGSAANVAGANTYFQFNDNGALGGNGALAFTKASKTLSIAADAPLDINSTTLSIADTDISFDGASTTFTGAGAMTVTPGAGTNLNVTLSTTGDFAVNTNQLYVDTSAAKVGVNNSSPVAALDVVGTIKSSTQVNGQTANFTTGNITTVNSTTGNIATVNATTVNSTTVNGASFDGSFTNGSLLFSNSSGVITQDNANIFYDNPSDKLLLGGATAGAAKTILGADGSGIFNEQGSAVNFRVESDSNANMLFVDGTNNRIGIGTNSPTTTLDVNGPLRVRSGSPALNYVLAAVDTTGTTTWKNVTDILTNGGAFLNALNDVISDKSSNLFLGNGSGLVNNGEYNTAVGILSLSANSSGNGNTAMGYKSMNPNTTGSLNASFGSFALNNNTSGFGNVAMGYHAGYTVSSGSYNTTLGYAAGDNISTGSRNIILGYDIDAVSATANDQINIGNTIYGNTSSGKISIGNSTNAPDAVLEVGNATVTNIDGTNDLIVADDVEIDDDLFVNDAATITGNATFSSMTAGSMLFAGTAGLLSQDNSKLFYDDATDKVLLGGATAGAAASIIGADGSVIINEQGSAVNTRIESDNKTNLFFADGANDKVAIGDSSPVALLDVGGGTATSIDGTDDLIVKDDIEIDDDLFVTDDATVGDVLTATTANITTANIATANVNGTIAYIPSSTTSITAGGGITVTRAIMRVQGSGGAIDITANPQIVDGRDGQIVTVKGMSNINTLTLDDGTGLSLTDGASFTLGLKDTINLIYDAGDDVWIEISRSNR